MLSDDEIAAKKRWIAETASAIIGEDVSDSAFTQQVLGHFENAARERAIAERRYLVDGEYRESDSPTTEPSGGSPGE